MNVEYKDVVCSEVVGTGCWLAEEGLTERERERERDRVFAGFGTVDCVNGHTSANVSGLVSSPQ